MASSEALKAHQRKGITGDNPIAIFSVNRKYSIHCFHLLLLLLLLFIVEISFLPCLNSEEVRRRGERKDPNSIITTINNFTHETDNHFDSLERQDTNIGTPAPLSPAPKPRPLGYYNYRFYKSFGGRGFGHGSFEYPVDIDVDRQDNIYICDKEAGHIQKFDSEGNFDDEWDRIDIDTDKIPFNQSGRMDNPEALCIEYKELVGKTFVYVVDTKNNRILQFNTEGRLIDPDGNEIRDKNDSGFNEWKSSVEAKVVSGLLWGNFGSRAGEFHNPTDVAIDSHDNCYVLDSKNNRVQCFDEMGKLKLEWGGFGSGPGNFIKPVKLAYDKSGFGSIWVIDARDGKLHQFDLEGNFLRALAPKGEDGKSLPKPTNFCFDNQGFIYLTDSSLNKVFKYNNDMEFVQSWGEEGSKPGQFKGISGIVVDSEERVLIVDSGNCRIQIFRNF